MRSVPEKLHVLRNYMYHGLKNLPVLTFLPCTSLLRGTSGVLLTIPLRVTSASRIPSMGKMSRSEVAPDMATLLWSVWLQYQNILQTKQHHLYTYNFTLPRVNYGAIDVCATDVRNTESLRCASTLKLPPPHLALHQIWQKTSCPPHL